jgi:hypothetical protein
VSATYRSGGLTEVSMASDCGDRNSRPSARFGADDGDVVDNWPNARDGFWLYTYGWAHVDTQAARIMAKRAFILTKVGRDAPNVNTAHVFAPGHTGLSCHFASVLARCHLCRSHEERRSGSPSIASSLGSRYQRARPSSRNRRRILRPHGPPRSAPCFVAGKSGPYVDDLVQRPTSAHEDLFGRLS